MRLVNKVCGKAFSLLGRYVFPIVGCVLLISWVIVSNVPPILFMRHLFDGPWTQEDYRAAYGPMY